ncbi:MAG: serine/threonine-protein kinase, partial [Planctomycetota bacterium]
MVRRARREDDATRDDATNDDVTRDDATPDDLTGEDATRDAQTLFSPGSPTESFLRYLDEQIAMLQRSGAGGPDTETGTGTENDGDCSAEIALVVDAADEAIRGGVAIDRQALVDHFPQYSPRLGKVLQTLRWVRKTAFVPDEKRRDECETPLPEIPDYKVSRRLGAGGMGVVYKARQLSLQRDVALKIIPQTLLSNELAIRRFELEARAAASLDHPHIVQVFDTGSSGGQHYFTMQLVRGSGLDQVVKRLHQSRMEARSNRIRWDLSKQQLGGALPAPASSSMDYERNHHREDSATLRAGLTFYQQVAAIGRDVAGALEHAHQNDVLHRDIKPSNLMLDRDGKVWVTDFGLAKTGDSELTGTGDIVGTIQFIAPERFSGFCDRRSDLYSLGMTLYELVSLQPAFARGDPLSLIARIRDTDPIPLSQIDRKLPRDLQTIIETSIQKDPARRYQSAGAMMADLQRFLRDEPIQARPAGRSYKAYRWLRRNRLAGSAIIASAVAILLLTVGSAYAAVRFAGDARAQLKLTLQADAAKRNAETLSEQNRRNLYAAEMRLAVDAAREPSGGPTVRSWLQRWDQPADRDRHGFEWHWLSGVVNPPATPLRFAAPDTLPAASPRNLAYAIDGQTAFLANRGLQYRNVSPLFDDTPTETHQQADAIATHRSTRRVACMIDGRCVWTHDPDRRSGGWSHDLPGVSAIAFIGPQWIAAIRQNPSKQNAYELFLLSVADGSVAAVLDCPQLDSTHLLPKYLRADVDDRWLALATHVAGEVHVHFFRVRNALPIDDDP